MLKNIRYSKILGLNLANLCMDETIEALESMLQSHQKNNKIYTPNSDFLVNAYSDPEFYQALSRAQLLLADGMPLVWASKLFGSPLKEKISGSTLFMRTCEYAHKHELKIYLLGAGPGIAETAKHKLEMGYPGVNICGTESPSFGFENNKSEIKKILGDLSKKTPDILIVGLGSPKQELWVDKYLRDSDIPIIMCLGAAIDFAAGSKKAPPQIVKRLGLGWLWRLVSEPRRLWRRYLVKDMKVWSIFLHQRLNSNTYKQFIRTTQVIKGDMVG